MQAQRALVGSLSEVVFVCLSVMGLRLKYTSLRILQHVSHLFYACTLDGRLFEGKMITAGQRMNAETNRRQLSAQQRDERRQYKSERRRLARQHQCVSLCSLDDPA